jgi:hypothetical protein
VLIALFSVLVLPTFTTNVPAADLQAVEDDGTVTIRDGDSVLLVLSVGNAESGGRAQDGCCRQTASTALRRGTVGRKDRGGTNRASLSDLGRLAPTVALAWVRSCENRDMKGRVFQSEFSQYTPAWSHGYN